MQKRYLQKLNNILISFFLIIGVNYAQASKDYIQPLKKPTLERLNSKEKTNFVHLSSFADIVEPLIPSVVNIYTIKYGNKINDRGSNLPAIIPVEQFNDFLDKFEPPTPFSFENSYVNPKAMVLGSGFIVDPEGYIITNDHVVSNSDEIYVKLSSGVGFPAKIIGSDAKTDLALLKIDAKQKLPAVKFANSKKTRVGDVVIAIGNPLGFGGTVTTGIISSKGRDLGETMDELVDDFIQTDAAINTGSSGGPLFDIKGEVIGLNTAISDVGTGVNIGIGFAIPSNTVQDIMKQLKEKGQITRGRLDIAIQDITTELSEALSLDKDYGVLVVNVQPGGTGERAGLKRGDLIIEFNGQKVLNSRKLQLFVAETYIGERVKLGVTRNNKLINLVIEIAEFKSKQKEIADDNEVILQKSGIIFANLSSSVRVKFGLDDKSTGIVVTKLTSQIINSDLKVGDLVMQLNKQPITNIQEFNDLYEKIKIEQKQKAVALIKRGNVTMFVALKIE